MKHGFRNGLVTGLVIGVLAGYFFSRLWTLLFLGVANGVVVLASGIWRPKGFRSRAAGQ